MSTLAIVQCGQRKIWCKHKHRDAGPTAAKNAYVSSYFRMNRAYAERFADQWVILSAKYGFLDPDTKIRNYNVTFLKSSTHPISVDKLRRQVPQMRLCNFEKCIVIGGADYGHMVQQSFDETGCRIDLLFKKYKGIGYIQQAVRNALKIGRPLKQYAW